MEKVAAEQINKHELSGRNFSGAEQWSPIREDHSNDARGRSHTENTGLPSSRDSHERQMLNAHIEKQEPLSLPVGKRDYGLKGL